MQTGLLHLHRTLAYLVFLVALADVVLVLTKARTDPKTAGMLRWCHSVGLMWAGRLAIAGGLVLFFVSGYPLAAWWAWVSLLLWGPIEAVGKRLVAPEVQAVRDGGQASGRLMAGVGIQLVCIVIIFGLMTVRPG
ncbi:MAG: hypothetical protein VX265_07360 [Myxococcota bacterium]|nr:hypothetical protein [Myxococcota bacterium]MEC8424010.1 hypothetical protein [Myxococcota bacterium]